VVLLVAGGPRAQVWRNPATAPGAPLPPAAGFRARAHGDEVAAAGLRPEVLGRLDIELQRHVAARNVAGVVALLWRQGRRGYGEAFGSADRDAARPLALDAVFRVMSMTKPLVAVTALTLYDEGRFGLDDPISRHCPEWAAPQVLANGRRQPARRAITPRMLLSHSSGLYYGTLPGVQPAPRGRQTTLREFSEAVAKEPLKFQPGAGWCYGLSLDILGRYLEALTGESLDALVRARLTGPLKMVDTEFWLPPEKSARLCRGYRLAGPGELLPTRDTALPATRPTLCLGGHGMVSTAGDYERFCALLLNRGEVDGVRVLRPETVDLMFQNHVAAPHQPYGLGGIVDGEGYYGWGGAWGTEFWVDRRTGLAALYLTQTDGYRAPSLDAFRALAGEVVAR
jgi:CubicO group peptidase (beta-lactamase class C family)